MQSQLAELTDALERLPNAPASLEKAVEEVIQQVSQVQRSITRVRGQQPGTPPPVFNSVSSLYSSLDGYTAAPTPSEIRQMEMVAADIKTVIGRVNNLVEKTIPNLNKQFKDASVPWVNPGEKIAVP
jgi:hypothetical protein